MTERARSTGESLNVKPAFLSVKQEGDPREKPEKGKPGEVPHSLRLDAVLEAVKLPASVTGLDTGLADVDGDNLTHVVRRSWGVFKKGMRTLRRMSASKRERALFSLSTTFDSIQRIFILEEGPLATNTCMT